MYTETKTKTVKNYYYDNNNNKNDDVLNTKKLDN